MITDNASAKSSRDWGIRGFLPGAIDEVSTAQLEFLPGALEVQDRPPSPAGRCVMWMLLILFCIGVFWALLGEIDVVVSAPGRVVPGGKVKIVQSPESAVVASISVRDGQRVEAGDILVSLEPTSAEADDVRVMEQLANRSRELAWRSDLEAWLAQSSDNGIPTAQEAYLGYTVVTDTDMILQQRQAEIAANLMSLNQKLRANASARDSIIAERERTEARLEILRERVGAYAALVQTQYGARVQYLEMLEQQTDLESSLPVLEANERKLLSDYRSIEASMLANKSEVRAKNLIEIERLGAESAMLRQDARISAERRDRQALRSPVTGTVQELAIHTTGAVVTPAQPLMKIVPEGAVLEVEALLQNKDIGFIRTGQHAAVKVDTFNFTKYGLIDAQVSVISNDAIEEQGVGWVFKTRMQLAADQILVAGKPVKLSPGMSVMAEIKIGKRRLIEFFLSPLLRYKQESLGER